jgi:uncharacterized protein YndB with AHSA1/START domain
MSDPTVPLRLEFTVEVPGTPEQVWDAIATAPGLSAWMMPTELDEREGGAVVFHMGAESSKGIVSGWEPLRRLVIEEDWATLAGQDPTTVTPLVSEFLVEATSGGTCVVRVVTSAFGSGADWEREFFDDMGVGWVPAFEQLRVYLTHFPGQRAALLEGTAEVPGAPRPVLAAIRRAVGADDVGATVKIRDTDGRVEHIGEQSFLVRMTEPITGLLVLSAFRSGDNRSSVRVGGYLFSDDAASYVEREQSSWQAWLEATLQAAPTGS